MLVAHPGPCDVVGKVDLITLNEPKLRNYLKLESLGPLSTSEGLDRRLPRTRVVVADKAVA